MEKLDGKKFINQAEALYEQALTETKELLKNNPNGAFIAIPDYEDVILSMNSNDLGLEIWAVGVNEKDHICIKAYEDQPYDCSVLEWYGLQWIDIEDGDINYEIDKRSYPDFYRFVVRNLNVATSKEEADKVAFDFD